MLSLVVGMLLPATGALAADGIHATSGDDPEVLVAQLLGSGVTVSNVTSTGVPRSRGTFTGGGPVVAIADGVVLSSGNAAGIPGPNTSDSYTANNGTAGDADLTLLADRQTYDAAVLEFDFVPSKDTVSFSYVFGSDEFNEYANTSYNDAFGFFVNGVNCAKLPDGSTTVSINNVNKVDNAQYFVNNDPSDGPPPHDTQMDGFTVPLTCQAAVNPGVTNHIKLAVADAGDSSYDSWVLLKSGSFTTEPVDENDAPVAVDDTNSTDEDTAVTAPAPGVLANDTDADGDALTATLLTQPSNGSVTLNADGSYTYTPNANFHGTDSFTYTANDGTSDSNVATVTLTVNPINDAPVAVDDSYSTDEDTALTIAAPGTLGNDTDADGEALTATISTGPANGTVTLNADGSFSYTPNSNFHGTDSFTYTASDASGSSSTATVHLTVTSVNDAPTCDTVQSDVFAMWPPNNKFQAVNLTGGSDLEGDALTLTITGVTQDEQLTRKGTPDAQAGDSASQVLLRASRDGNGDGRVYAISYTLRDSAGASCTGTKLVSVQHDSGNGMTAFDSGQTVNSFGK